MMKRTLSPVPAQSMDSHRPDRCYHRIVSELDDRQRKISVLVVALFVVVPDLFSAGCYYSANTFPPMSGDGTDSGTDGGDGSGPDTDPNNCFGTPPFNVCFDPAFTQALTQPLSIPDQPINTSNDTRCVLMTVAGTESCVLAGKTITVETTATLRATGSRPLVLIAVDTIMISGTVDVGSHRVRDGRRARAS